MLALVIVPVAARSAQLRDLDEGRDHPIVSRYAGSVLIGYDTREFAHFTLPLGPLERAGTGPIRFEPAKTQVVEGRTTRLLDVAPEKRSPLEVSRNYQQELNKAGFRTLYTCTGRECGGQAGSLSRSYLYDQERRLNDAPPGATGPRGQMTAAAFTSPQNQQYLVARLARPAEGDVYVSLLTATESFAFYPETHNRTLVLLDIIEMTPMKGGMVTVDAAAMARDIDAAGHVALYGLYFDTGRSDIKPESEPTLREIAALLKANPPLTLYVVGHTVNVSGFDANMDLSRRRAEAVVAYLTTKLGVAASRLEAAGVGLMAPVAPNDTADGRAKNRRVELVKR